METGILVGAIILLIIVLIFQSLFWRKSNKALGRIREELQSWRETLAAHHSETVSRPSEETSPKLLVKIQRDIESRMSMGGQPDWQTYAVWMERFVRAQLEIIRQQANSALVLGILGTIGIALIEFLGISIRVEDVRLDFADWTLKAGILLTLGSSAVGMLNHLFISQRKLRQGEESSDEFLESAEDLIRSFAAGISRPSLPGDSVLAEPINQLSGSVAGLSTAQEHQTVTIAAILADQRALVENSTELYGTHTAKVASALELHSGHLTQLFEELRELPGMIRGAIETVPALLAQEIIKGHRYVEQIRDAVDGGIYELTESIKKGQDQMAQSAMKSLEGLVGQLDRHADTLGQAVRDTRLEVTEIGSHLENGNIKLREALDEGLRKMRSHFVSNTEEIINEILAEYHRRSKNLVWEPLEKLAEELGIVATEVPGAAITFRESVGTAAQRIASLPDGLQEVQTRLKEISDDFAKSQTTFRVTLESVRDTTIDVTKRTEQLHGQIGTSVDGLVKTLELLVDEFN